MTDLLEQSSAWLEAKRHKHLTRLVVYQRGGQSVQVAATAGRTLFDLDDGAGATIRVESRDFLVRAADLVFDNAPVLPQRGDLIRETAGGQVFVYEVMAPGPQPHWRYSDPYRQTLRIHTKLAGSE